MQQAEIYTKDYCPYCQRAKELLSIKGIRFIEHDVTRDSELESLMRKRTGRHTVPQIFIADQHIGGCDELFALDEQGKLDPLLKIKRRPT
ncbi:MAG: glutaredoxin 3 [Geopsychrobacter sp.]|nr:glutaredoxin 3 [Geopsychrobacter sp.]